MKLVYVDREQLNYEREMERFRLRMIGEGRCCTCERIVVTAGGVLAGMLVCKDCAEEELAVIEKLLGELAE